MSAASRPQSAAELKALTGSWWDAPVIDPGGDGFDDEVRAINALASEIEGFPEWALQLREAMPKWGFEMCAHRWLDGLDEVMGMLGEERYCPSTAGHCGEIPGRIVAAADARGTAVQDWLDGVSPRDELGRKVNDQLGDHTPEKLKAARCFVEMLRAKLIEGLGREEFEPLAQAWKTRADGNEILADLLAPYGYDDLLQNACGFLLVERLDLNIRLIGGDREHAKERIGNCNSQLRFMWSHDLPRYAVTRGYLWGLHAYLREHDAGRLRQHKPDCAGAAICALSRISSPGEPTLLRRWLVASLLKATKIWCRRALLRSGKQAVPAWADDLPDLLEALAA